MLTILISTMNRSDFLKRALHYYAKTKYRHWIYIGDSSDAFHSGEAKKTIESLKSVLNVRYFEYPSCRDSECMKMMIDEVTTPYAAYVADDDFLVPAGIDKCMDFLRKNEDYMGANGKAFVFTLKEPGAWGEFVSVGPYGQNELVGDTAVQRLRVFSNVYAYFTALFSILKTEAWKQMYKYSFDIADRSFAGELAPCFIAAIEGNIKHIDTLYLGRQVHKRRYRLPDGFDWITDAKWNDSYQIFFNSLTEGLVRKDGIDEKSARDIVKQVLWRYLSTGLSSKFQSVYGKPLPRARKRLKEIVKNIPAAAPLLYKIKELTLPMSLPALLSRRSPYHQDFMLLYNHITNAAASREVKS